MSKTKIKQFSIFLLIFIFSLFLYACKTTTKVESIYFADETIALLVGETYSPKVNVIPSYATNRAYTISTENPEIVSVKGNVLTALKEGTAIIRVISSDNDLLEDVMSVTVRSSTTTLDTPTLTYNSSTETIAFDMISFASSYTLRINGIDIDLGNSTSYTLTEFNKLSSAYDTILSIQVRANAPTYSNAYESSEFSSAIRIYQAQEVENLAVTGGVLTFDSANSSNYLITLEGNTVAETSLTTLDLTDVDLNLNGTCDLSVTSVVLDELKTDKTVSYYNSTAATVRVQVLPDLSAYMIDSLISWQSSSYVDHYNIYIDGTLKANTSNNYFDLSDLEDYNGLIYNENGYVLKVEPVIYSSSIGLIKTLSSTEIIEFNRLNTPVVTAENNLISWNAVENASSYEIILSYSDSQLKTILETTTFSLDNYPSDETYTFKVRAIYVAGENNLSSLYNEVEIYKQATAEISISEYVLNIVTVQSDSYLIAFTTSDWFYSYMLTATSELYSFNLSTYDFVAGENTIYVTHLGNGEKIFDSMASTISFVQLEDDSALTISNGILTVTKTEINSQASYVLKIIKSENSQVYEVVFNSSATGTLNYTFNTTDEEENDYLSAGNYSVTLYIIGDGETTFSLGTTGLSSASADFEVLSAPTLSVNDKSKAVLTATSSNENVAYYDIYKINGTSTLFATNVTSSVEFDIDSEILQFYAQTIGDGSSTLNSCYSKVICVQKLVAPILTYDEDTGVISISDSNASNLVYGYVLKINGESSSYSFGTEYTSFVVGDNTFVVYIEAIDAANDYYYLNSDSYELNINKVDAGVEMEINCYGQLIIVPTSEGSQDLIEHDLILSITVLSTEIVLTSNDKILSNDTYSLDYEYVKDSNYSSGAYVINLLNADYSLVISELTSNFSVKVKFVPKDASSSVSSTFSESFSVTIETASEVGRSKQYLTIKLVDVSHNYQNYSLILNDSVVIDLDTSVSLDSEAGLILVDIDYVYSYLEDNSARFIVAIITNNLSSSSDDLRLPKKGEAAYVQRANQLDVASSKDNSADNNSVVISFEIDQEDFEKTYILNVYNLEENVRTNLINKAYSNSDADEDGVIEFYLDDIDLTGKIYVTVLVSTTGYMTEDGNIILMFNSIESEEIVFTKISAVSNVYVSNGVLMFDVVDGAVGYEVYVITGSGKTKINTGLLQSTSYDLTNLKGEATIAVKAISSSGSYTNSNLSDTIDVYKLSTPSITVINGELNLILSSTEISLLSSEEVDIKIMVSNDTETLYFDFSNAYVSVSGQYVQILSEALLNFGVNSLLKEALTFKIEVDYYSTNEEIYYINSNSISEEVYGLLTVEDVLKQSYASDNAETIESISYTINENNVIDEDSVVYGVVFKIMANGTIYYSTDSKLMYRTISTDDDGNETYSYLSYAEVISGTSFIFPYGYDKNNNGEIDSSEEFAAGTFSICIKTIAKTISGFNILNSAYSEAVTFTILSTPSLVISGGTIIWASSTNCTYLVRIYEGDECVAIDTVTTAMFDFSNTNFDDYSGLFGVSVQTISSSSLILNSKESDVMTVYRMPTATDVQVDDGYLVLYANAYFSTAEITFVDTITSKSEIITYTNADASNNLTNLNISSWSNYSSDVSTLSSSQTYIVIYLDSAILNITDNRSYYITVRLIGNSNENLPIINSATYCQAGELVVTKLSASISEVSTGVFTFNPIDEYENLNLNYNFNSANLKDNSIWNSSFVYKISITVAGSVYEIYALDYNSFNSAITSNLITSSDYEIITDKENLYAVYKYYDGSNYLYFNVFKDNSINLKNCNYIYYYAITNTLSTSASVFSGSTTISQIDLSVGGTFVVAITLLGGDSIIVESTVRESHTAFLTANVNTLKTFVRYSENYLSTLSGQLLLNDMTIEVDGNIVDYPIYKLRVNLINSSDITYVYLYYSDKMTEEAAKSITEDDDGTYVSIVFSESSGILFDFALYFDSGSYQVDVQTLAGSTSSDESEADYLLDASVPTTKYSIRKITSTSFTVSSGDLKFDLAYVLGSAGSKVYVYNYEITIYDSDDKQTYVYEIDNSDITVSSYVATYTLPSSIVTTSNDTVTLNNSHSYQIKIKALAQDTYIINASYLSENGADVVLEFTRSSGVSSESGKAVRIEDGVLKWTVLDLTNYTQTKIQLSYYDSNNELQYIIFQTAGTAYYDENGNYLYHYYEFTDNVYTITSTGGSTYISSSVDYTVTLCTVGNSSATTAIINSSYSNEVSLNRLSSVNTSSIIASDGVLTWTVVSGAVKYVVTLVGDNTYTFEVEGTSIDFLSVYDSSEKLLEAGNYIVHIKALGNDYANSMKVYSSTSFTKLAVVENIGVYSEDKNYITWDKVEGAEGYLAIFTYSNSTYSELITGGDNLLIEVPDGISGQYTITVIARGVGSSYVFNGEAGSYTSSTTRPDAVGAISWDSENLRYYWTVSDDFLTSDNLRISYNIREYQHDSTDGYSLSDTSTQEVVTISGASSSNYYVESGVTYYYFEPSIIGYYTEFIVQVERADSIYSSTTRGENVYFNLFAYGEGTSDNPYAIYNSTHLINIAKKNDKNFILINSIDLSSLDFASQLGEYNALISDEFSGKLNGKNYVLYGLQAVSLDSVTNFALFNSITGGNIENLTIGLINVASNVSNSFANSCQDVVNLSVIAVSATNAILNNVTVNTFNFVITGVGSLDGYVYAAGLVANLTNSTVTDCNVVVSFSFDIDFTPSAYAYVGGMVALSSASSLTSDTGFTSSLTLTQKSSEYSFYCVGGVAAYFTGETARTSSISNATATVNFTDVYATYLGGIVGYIYQGTITNSISTGSITNRNINISTDLGGVAGLIRSSTITKTGTNITFNLYVTNSSTTDVYIGVFVGYIRGDSEGITISNCYSNMDVSVSQTSISGASDENVNYAMYGYILNSSYVTIEYWNTQTSEET